MKSKLLRCPESVNTNFFREMLIEGGVIAKMNEVDAVRGFIVQQHNVPVHTGANQPKALI